MAASSNSSLVDANGDKITPMRVRDELTRGRTMADQLLVMISEIVGGNSTSPPQPSAADDLFLAAWSLVGKISDAFARSILMLDEEDYSLLTPPAVDSSAVRKTEDSGDSGKRPAQKDRRGCYKRRRSQKTYTRDTPDLFQDGHGWRKYGQKRILDSDHPRNYYRCTHKYDQGCKAKKHVQQIQENPPMYRTTYDGQHTCKNLIAKMGTSSSSAHHQLLNDDDDHDVIPSSLFWNFQHQPKSFNNNISELMIEQGNDSINAVISEIAKTPSSHQSDYYISPYDHFDANSNISEVYSSTASTHDDTMDQQHMNGGEDSVFDELFVEGLISYRGLKFV